MLDAIIIIIRFLPLTRSWTVFELHFKPGNFLHMYESLLLLFPRFSGRRSGRFSVAFSSPTAIATKAGKCIETRGNHAAYLRARESRSALRIRYFFELLFSQRNLRIRRIDNGIRLLPCHPLPRNNTLPSYNSLPANQYFCPGAAHGIGRAPIAVRSFPARVCCLTAALL